MKCNTDLESFRRKAQSVLSSTGISYTGFTELKKSLAKKQDTISFWYQFLIHDCFAYIALYVGIRYRCWALRMGSLEQQAAIFSALIDRSTYERIIPQYLHDVINFPDPVLAHLQKGSFSIRFNTSEWHGVALDECHKMKINKDAKLAVIRPSKERMKFLSNYLSFRSKCVHNLTKQISPVSKKSTDNCSHKVTCRDKKAHVNI